MKAGGFDHREAVNMSVPIRGQDVPKLTPTTGEVDHVNPSRILRAREAASATE